MPITSILGNATIFSTLKCLSSETIQRAIDIIKQFVSRTIFITLPTVMVYYKGCAHAECGNLQSYHYQEFPHPTFFPFPHPPS